MSARDIGRHDEAVVFAEQSIRVNSGSDWLWREFGNALTKVGRLDEARNALETAMELDAKAPFLWRYLAALHRKNNNLGEEIDSLQNLDRLGAANSTDLNQLGIAY